MITFKEYLLYEKFLERKYWVSPDGTMHDITYSAHEDWALENIVDADEILAKFPYYNEEDSGDSEEGRGEIFTKAHNNGWVDICISGDQMFIRVPWGSINYKIKSELKDFAIEHGLDILQYHWNKPKIIYSGK